MTNEEIIDKINTGLASHGALDNSVKFDFKDGSIVYVEGMAASDDDKAADCTIILSKKDLIAMAKRELDPMAAFMSGKLKISGDMSVALGLRSLFAAL